MIGALSTSLAGMTAAFARLDRAAGKIASADSTDSLPEAAVDLVEARTSVRANAAVLRSTDETIGTLLDVLA